MAYCLQELEQYCSNNPSRREKKMDFQAVGEKLVEGLHFFTSITGGVVVALVALLVALGSTKFLRKEQRGTEEGKDMLKNAAITLAVVAGAWVLANATYGYFAGLFG